ncbi:hypothetical protein RHSIM_Rhsim08G0141100 [Rhododendron simsii]|uniref:Ribonuclease H1 N-terminal domain-containing protein n=1 Tax=Rhododendron simsii TaxID=118357 RepID=A0A834LIZ2_RHOSS|nr:hypothetical protein RHSIM_Rhsim08G0141100 [Rhododendron simsii]
MRKIINDDDDDTIATKDINDLTINEKEVEATQEKSSQAKAEEVINQPQDVNGDNQNLPKEWRYVQNHPKELILDDPSKGILVNQAKYAKELIKKFGMEGSKPMSTPMSTSTKLDKDENGKPVNEKMYRGLFYPRGVAFDLVGYSDADFGGFKVDRKRMAEKRFYYVDFVGKVPGIDESWIDCSEQITSFSGAVFKKYPSLEEANNAWTAYVEAHSKVQAHSYVSSSYSTPDRLSTFARSCASKHGWLNSFRAVQTLHVAVLRLRSPPLSLSSFGGNEKRTGEAYSGNEEKGFVWPSFLLQSQPFSRSLLKLIRTVGFKSACFSGAVDLT